MPRALICNLENWQRPADFAKAAECAEKAYRLIEAGDPEPESLIRYYTLLCSANHPLARDIKELAAGYDINLEIQSDKAQSHLKRFFLNRELELTKLQGLEEGQWAVVYGGSGMGKTVLLKELNGHYLPARSGLPYATLEPLLPPQVLSSPETILDHLRNHKGQWLLDDWQDIDPDSQQILSQLRKMRPPLKVILSAREPLPFQVDVECKLMALDERALKDYPGLYEQTGGMPSLVAAYLHEEPLEEVLEQRLKHLSPQAQDIYLALASLDEANPSLVRRALNIEANHMAQILEQLLMNGLTNPSGKVYAKVAANRFLENYPSRAAPLALSLARQLRQAEAYLLYQKAKLFWEEKDLPAIAEASLAWAKELLKRGFAQRALEALAPLEDYLRHDNLAHLQADIHLYQATAFERSGQFHKALAELEGLSETPANLALKSILYSRLGQTTKAKEAAEVGLKGGDLESKAMSLSSLSQIALSQGNYSDAERFSRQAATLWLALNDENKQLGALNNAAIAKLRLGQDAEADLKHILSRSQNPLLRARLQLNLGLNYEQKQASKQALNSYQEAIRLAQEAGSTATAAVAYNNIGALHHKAQEKAKAKEAYQQAFSFAQQTGEQRRIASILANLAELEEDYDMWCTALEMLEAIGHGAIAQRHRQDLPEHHPFILRSRD
ncbi:MAG: hypothetical protein R2865_14335 [Deinococcales bacterium]